MQNFYKQIFFKEVLMKLIKENYQFFILILLLFSIDRITKIKILDILQNKNFIFVNDFLNLTLVEPSLQPINAFIFDMI